MNAPPPITVANEQPAVQHFLVFVGDTWQQLSLLFRGEIVGSRFHEAVWQRAGTLKAIKATTLQRLIDAGEAVRI